MELKEYKLGDIAEIVNGSTPTTTCPHYYDGDIVWITPKDLSEQKSKYIEKGERNITEAGFNSCSTHLIPKYNILLTSRAPIGLLAINKVACCTNQGFKNLIVNKDIVDVDYLYYYLKYHIAEIEALGTGTTFKEVSKASMEKYTVSLPDIEEQKKVSSILSALDAKISLNKQINQNLEALARQLYDYWFVQFDFPNEKGKPYKSSGGKMVYNPILKREIPEGWEVKRLQTIVNISRGSIITESQSHIGNVKVVAAATSYSYFHNVANRTANVITISSSGANAGYINFWREPIFASDCITIQANNDIDTILVYHNLELYKQFIMQNSHGSAQPHVYPSDIQDLPFICIPEELKERISELYLELNKDIANNLKEIESLTKQRDELLPLLMNGQVNFDLCAD